MRKSKKTKIQKAADKFRAKVDADADLLLNPHPEIGRVAGGDPCIYCLQPGCERVDLHGPEHDEREESCARDAAAFAEQQRIDLAHYTAAREAVEDFWSVDSAGVLGRLQSLEDGLFDAATDFIEVCGNVQELRTLVGALLIGSVILFAGLVALGLKVMYP